MSIDLSLGFVVCVLYSVYSSKSPKPKAEFGDQSTDNPNIITGNLGATRQLRENDNSEDKKVRERLGAEKRHLRIMVLAAASPTRHINHFSLTGLILLVPQL